MIVSLIVAVSRDGLIGAENRLPWHLPRDLKRFRKRTWGKTIVMGRRTYESLGRPLEGRHNVVLSRRRDLRIEGCQVAGSLAEAIALAAANAGGDLDAEVMIIGGGEVFREALSVAERVDLTVVEASFEGDVYFPMEALDSGAWRRVEEEAWPADEKNRFAFRFVVLERVREID